MTSPPEEIVVDCPACGPLYYDWYRASINANLDPEMAADHEYLVEASTATCPNCQVRVDLGVLSVEDDVWRVHDGVRPRTPEGMLIVCVDVGSVRGGRLGWACEPITRDRSESEYRDIGKLVETVGDALAKDRPVALGFECPMFLPVPEDPRDLGRAREGEGNRAWSAGAGAGSLATGVVEIAWILRELRKRCPEGQLHLDWPSFAIDERGLYLWEAFVTAEAKAQTRDAADPHVADAKVAVRAFRRTITASFPFSDVRADNPLSLAGAAAAWSGWLPHGLRALETPALVVKATAQDARS